MTMLLLSIVRFPVTPVPKRSGWFQISGRAVPTCECEVLAYLGAVVSKEGDRIIPDAKHNIVVVPGSGKKLTDDVELAITGHDDTQLLRSILRCCLATSSRMPFTYLCDSVAPKSLASSMPSLMTTL